VIGQLDCRMEFQGGEAVRVKLAEIDAEWAERRTQLADRPAELRRAEATYRRIRERYETAPRLFVLAGYAELLSGEPMTLEHTFDARREFVRSRRQQQATRRARTVADRAGRAAMRPDVAESIADMPVIAMVTDVGMDLAAGASRTGKPRRRAGEAVVSDAVTTTNDDGSCDDGAAHTDEA